MFRIGWHQEEKEIFMNTIHELRELKEELALLKNSIHELITPESACSVEQGKVENHSQENSAEKIPGQEIVSELAEVVGAKPEEDGQQLQFVVCKSQGSDIASGLKGSSEEAEGEAETHLSEKIPEETGAENGKPLVNLNWAVVSHYHQRKSWWNQCQSGIKAVKRVILKA